MNHLLPFVGTVTAAFSGYGVMGIYGRGPLCLQFRKPRLRFL